MVVIALNLPLFVEFCRRWGGVFKGFGLSGKFTFLSSSSIIILAVEDKRVILKYKLVNYFICGN